MWNPLCWVGETARPTYVPTYLTKHPPINHLTNQNPPTHLPTYQPFSSNAVEIRVHSTVSHLIVKFIILFIAVYYLLFKSYIQFWSPSPRLVTNHVNLLCYLIYSWWEQIVIHIFSNVICVKVKVKVKVTHSNQNPTLLIASN